MIVDEQQCRSRAGNFAHYCYEWDEMLIDETDPEFMSCLCWTENPQAETIRKAMNDEHNAWNIRNDKEAAESMKQESALPSVAQTAKVEDEKVPAPFGAQELGRLPARIILSADQSFPVNDKFLRGCLGRLDRSTGEIDIHSAQPQAGKHVILLHEILHFVAEILVQGGAIKKQPSEAFISSAAPLLLNILVRSGMYSGLGVEELDLFMEADSL